MKQVAYIHNFVYLNMCNLHMFKFNVSEMLFLKFLFLSSPNNDLTV